MPRRASHQQEHLTWIFKLKGKTALVTGGSEGIGKGIALALAQGRRRRRDLRPPQGAAGTPPPRSRKATKRKIVPITADLSKDADAKNFIEQGHKALGRIDIMINNAGSSPGGVIEHLTEADWAQSLQLKFMGYVRCLRYVLPIMVKQGGGRVVNLIGNDGVKPSYWEIAPGAANAAGQNLTVSLAGQYGKHNISFCAVNPGPVRTERWAGLVTAMSRDMKICLRGGRQAGAVVDPAGPHRRGRGGRQPRRHAGVAAHAHGQRHPDRDRRRPGEVADGPRARSQVTAAMLRFPAIETVRRLRCLHEPSRVDGLHLRADRIEGPFHFEPKNLRTTAEGHFIRARRRCPQAQSGAPFTCPLRLMTAHLLDKGAVRTDYLPDISAANA